MLTRSLSLSQTHSITMVGVEHVPLAEVMFRRGLHCQVILLFPFFPYWTLEENHNAQATLRKLELHPISLREAWVQKIFGFVSSLSFLIGSDHLLIWTHGYLF